jgi:DNA recombination protein RmuC
MNPDTLLIVLLFLVLAAVVLLLVLLLRKSDQSPALQAGFDRLDARLTAELSASRQENSQGLQATRTEVTGLFGLLSDQLLKSLKDSQDQTAQLSKTLGENVKYLNETVRQRIDDLTRQNEEFRKEMETKLKEMRETLEMKVGQMQQSNETKLDEMRKTVDEKLQKTLDERLSESFKQVSDRLEQVHKGLGEMQTLAQDVGGLKKVLSNVKTRGVLGEIQLSSILETILAPEQYVANVKTKPGSNDHVEFAICLPGKDEDGKPILLPVDAKFPMESYTRLVDAFELADVVALELARKALESDIRKSAKDISEKYISPPHTTDFGILFLPTESLFAEVMRNTTLVENLQRQNRIVICGPTTLAAFLNSLQMGFRTLAIEKRSSEVWKILAMVRKEFNSFGDVLDKAQDKIKKAGEDIEKLVGTRTRAIQRSLRGVEELPAGDLPQLSISDDTLSNDVDDTFE